MVDIGWSQFSHSNGYTSPSIMSKHTSKNQNPSSSLRMSCGGSLKADYHPPPRSTLSAKQQSHHSDGTWQQSPCPWFCLLREHQPPLQNMRRQNPDNCPAEIDFTSKAWLFHHMSGKLEALLRMTPVSSHQQARVRGRLTRHCWKNGLMLGGAGTSTKTEIWSDSPTGCDLITLTGSKFKPPAGEGYFLFFQNLHIFESKHGWNFGLNMCFLEVKKWRLSVGSNSLISDIKSAVAISFTPAAQVGQSSFPATRFWQTHYRGPNSWWKTFRTAEWGRARLLNHDALPAAGAQTASQWIFAVHAPKNTTARRGHTNVLASRFIIKLTQSKVCQTHVNGWRPQLWYKECSKGNLVLSKMVE